MSSPGWVHVLGPMPRRDASTGLVLVLGLLVAVGGTVGRANAAEVDPELLGRAQEVIVLFAHLGPLALLGDDVDVERQAIASP